MYDYSLFYKKNGTLLVFVVVYVDDVTITGNDLDKIHQLNLFLYNKFKMKDLGQLHYFLGLRYCTKIMEY